MGMDSSRQPAQDRYPGKTASDLQDPAFTSLIDFVRWLSAFMVMVGHARNPLLLGFGQLSAEQRSPVVAAWYFVTGFHAEAVLVFFVLSGYLVGGLSSARIAQGSYNATNYLIDRVSRLYVVYLPALLLTCLLDWLGAHWFANSGLYDGTHAMIATKDHGIAYANLLNWNVFFANLAMMQEFHTPSLGSNQPLWTLSCEFWFYMIFATGAASLRGKAPKVIGFMLLTLMIALWNGPEFLIYLGLWLIGMGLAFIKRPRRALPALALAAILAWLVVLRLNDAWLDEHLGMKHAAHYVLALLVGWLLIAFRGHTPALFGRVRTFNRKMADFSYSLYLIHFPVIVFAIAALGRFTGLAGFYRGFDPNDPMGVAAYCGIVAATTVLAWLFAQATEAHTKTVRQSIRRMIGRLGAHRSEGRIGRESQ